MHRHLLQQRWGSCQQDPRLPGPAPCQLGPFCLHLADTVLALSVALLAFGSPAFLPSDAYLACLGHLLRSPWYISPASPVPAGILELFITQLAQVLQHHSGPSQTRQNFPARHLWLCVKFQFAQPAGPIACQSLSPHPVIKLSCWPPCQGRAGRAQC